MSGKTNFGFVQRSETWLAVAMLVMLVVLIIPLPTFLLDMFLAFNLAAAIMLLLVVLGAKQPLEVSVFPSVLLLLTLFRLSLNVGTTRLILLNANAGKIVHTFGDFVVGGNLIVGVVIFLILVTIQFIVITKGATRISEVNARFTLDAMPGKQMAIDAELNSGAINEKQAREKRENLTSEAEFYGAMDGASKYVRGDAIAGLIIMAVNIFGGVLLGVVYQGSTIVDALQEYSILTIGDGLVSQIPALIIATSAGILVTKSSSDESLGDEISLQVSRGYKSLYIGAFIMLIVSLTPGFPKIPFLLIGVGLFIFVNRTRRKELEENAKKAKEARANQGEVAPDLSPEEKSLEEFLLVDRVIVELGSGLIPIVEPNKGTGIAKRIGSMREDMAKKRGLWIPQARIRDNFQMNAYDYRFLVNGREVGKGQLMLDRILAINPGHITKKLDGIETRDPAFDMPAIWIETVNKARAEKMGFTVADPAAVLVTHLSDCLRKLAHELLSREDMQKMLDKLKEYAPTTVEDSREVKSGVLHQLLVNLLAEAVPITSLEKIVESAIYHNSQNAGITELTERVRETIGHLICEPFRGNDGRLRVILMEPRLEHHLRQSIHDQRISLAPAALERFVMKIQSAWDTARLKQESVALIVDSAVRHPLRQAMQRTLQDVSVIAYNEIPPDVLMDVKSVIQFNDIVKPDDGVVPEFLPQATQDSSSEVERSE